MLAALSGNLESSFYAQFQNMTSGLASIENHKHALHQSTCAYHLDEIPVCYHTRTITPLDTKTGSETKIMLVDKSRNTLQHKHVSQPLACISAGFYATTSACSLLIAQFASWRRTEATRGRSPPPHPWYTFAKLRQDSSMPRTCMQAQECLLST